MANVMHAKVLEYAIYKDEWKHKTQTISPVSWDDIDAAVRRLDKFHWPFIWLWPTADDSQHDVDCEMLQVIGGAGEYWLAITAEGYFERCVLNPQGADAQVVLWTSDQGFTGEDRYVCRDIDIVLRATRHYAVFGGFDPETTWDPDPAQSRDQRAFRGCLEAAARFLPVGDPVRLRIDAHGFSADPGAVARANAQFLEALEHRGTELQARGGFWRAMMKVARHIDDAERLARYEAAFHDALERLGERATKR